MNNLADEFDGLCRTLEDALQAPNTGQGFTQSMRGLPAIVGSTTGPRRQTNEDRTAAIIIERPKSMGGPLFVAVVCDGIGGQKWGERSASLATAAFLSASALSRAHSPDIVAKEAVEAANKAVHILTDGFGGTTLVAVVITADGRLAGVNCGDSRIMRLDGETGHQLSQDQTLGAAIRNARPNAQKDISHARFDGELANFIGIGKELQPEFLKLDEVRPNDTIVLATDGTWNAIGSELLFKILQAAPTPSDAVKRALATINFADGPDNASITMITSLTKAVHTLKERVGRIQEIDILKVTGCTPNGMVSVIIYPPTNKKKANIDSADQKKGNETTPDDRTKSPKRPAGGRRSRKARSSTQKKAANQATLDLGGSEREQHSTASKDKNDVGKIEVVIGGDTKDEQAK